MDRCGARAGGSGIGAGALHGATLFLKGNSMPGILTNFGRETILRAAFRDESLPSTAHFLSLHTALPTVGNEITPTGTGYARGSITRNATGTGWTAPVSAAGATTIANAAQITIGPVPAGGTGYSATHWAVWDAVTGGTMLASGPIEDSLGNPKTVSPAAEDPVIFGVGKVALVLT
jgi:hypothetical protein